MPLPDGISPTTMKNRILRVAAELGIPVTIRRVPGGLIFWRSTDEDLQQAQEIVDTTPIRSAAATSDPARPPPACITQRTHNRL